MIWWHTILIKQESGYPHSAALSCTPKHRLEKNNVDIVIVFFCFSYIFILKPLNYFKKSFTFSHAHNWLNSLHYYSEISFSDSELFIRSCFIFLKKKQRPCILMYQPCQSLTHFKVRFPPLWSPPKPAHPRAVANWPPSALLGPEAPPPPSGSEPLEIQWWMCLRGALGGRWVQDFTHSPQIYI